MQEPGFISYVDYIQQRDCITLLPSSWVDVIRNNGIKSNHKIKDPDKKRAEDTLSFATQLLRSVYEIDYRTNSFTPACLLSANFLALFLSTPNIHTPLWPFPHVHILQTQDGCLCPLKIRMDFLVPFLVVLHALHPASRVVAWRLPLLQFGPVSSVPEGSVAEQRQTAFHEKVRQTIHLRVGTAVITDGHLD